MILDKKNIQLLFNNNHMGAQKKVRKRQKAPISTKSLFVILFVAMAMQWVMTVEGVLVGSGSSFFRSYVEGKSRIRTTLQFLYPTGSKNKMCIILSSSNWCVVRKKKIFLFLFHFTTHPTSPSPHPFSHQLGAGFESFGEPIWHIQPSKGGWGGAGPPQQ